MPPAPELRSAGLREIYLASLEASGWLTNRGASGWSEDRQRIELATAQFRSSFLLPSAAQAQPGLSTNSIAETDRMALTNLPEVGLQTNLNQLPVTATASPGADSPKNAEGCTAGSVEIQQRLSALEVRIGLLERTVGAGLAPQAPKWKATPRPGANRKEPRR